MGRTATHLHSLRHSSRHTRRWRQLRAELLLSTACLQTQALRRGMTCYANLRNNDIARTCLEMHRGLFRLAAGALLKLLSQKCAACDTIYRCSSAYIFKRVCT